MPAAIKMYNSSYYEDDLAWGASWLYRKTGDKHFLQVRILPLRILPLKLEPVVFCGSCALGSGTCAFLKCHCNA